MLHRMRFSGTWRDYQARVLDQMEDHLGDDRLHVVAAPGAGKTVLGLEIVRRLGRSAIVFAPSLAIRDQWRERLTPLFLPEPPGPDEISRDLGNPLAMTLATYQSLDSYRRSDDLSALIERLNEAGPFTLVLDEAHHLRKSWWECLNRLANELSGVQIVALTATPPYDASLAEWNRYTNLCGPIDLEIGIPELVRNGDLCPHQDHVILSEPTQDALDLLENRRAAIAALQTDLRNDDELLDWLSEHPWLTQPNDNLDAILEAPEMLSAVLVLLGSAERTLPSAPLDLLGVKARDVPLPSQFWLERLLDGLVFRHTDAFPIDPGRRTSLERRLHRQGLIEGKRVRLGHTRSVFRLLASSLGKMESIAAIAKAEGRTLENNLRMVVLSDHIRAGELPASPVSEFSPAKLGVVPIFETLRRADIEAKHLAVLTGSLVIVPHRVMEQVTDVLDDLELSPADVRQRPLKACPEHCELQSVSGNTVDLTRIVTALFQRGDIRIIVGTQSLLGQGWDAPALNSLILASNTASFMLSNQMRGRAIRIDPERPDKVANIWHLATIEPGLDGLEEAVGASLEWGALKDNSDTGLTDIGLVARRFKAFECISNGASNLIESGLSRLGLDPTLSLEDQNAATYARSADRDQTVAKWEQSLGNGEARSQVRETVAPTYSPRAMSWDKTLQSLLWTALGGAGFALANEVRDVAVLQSIGTVAMGATGVLVLGSLPGLFKAARLTWRNGSLEKSLLQVAQAVLESLAAAGCISPQEADGANFEIHESLVGRKDIIVIGVTRATERQIMVAIAEILGPVQNPRYLLERKSLFGLANRTDYHAVPDILGTRKEDAVRFADIWRLRVGPSDLIFTRNRVGRQVLLRARVRSFASGFQRAVDRRSAWL